MAVYTEIHIRRDSTLNWYAANPRLALGEPGVDMDLHRFKIGNGIDRWNELPYMDDDLYKLLDKTQQDIADHVQALLNKINTNKIDSDQKINALTTEVRNTSRDLQGRMTAVEDEQAEYEESLTGEFENTKSAVNAGLEEFNTTRDNLTVRMDVIAGSATEDTEILDARVDAENVTHPNLGHNIRSLHSELLDYKAQETSERVTADSELSDRINNLDEGLQTQADKHESDYDLLSGRISQNDRETSQLFDDVAATRQESNLRDQHLQEQADILADLAISQAIKQAEHTKAITELESKDRDLQNQLDGLDENLNHAESLRESRDSHLQSQIDELSESSQVTSLAIFEESQNRKKADLELCKVVDKEIDRLNVNDEVLGNEIQEAITNEAALRVQSDEALHDEIETAKSETLQAVNQETQDRQESDAILQDDISATRQEIQARGDYLQGQADILADLVLDETFKHNEDISQVKELISSEADSRLKSDEILQSDISAARESSNARDNYLQEQANDLALGVITNTASIKNEAQQRKETLTHFAESQTERADYLQEQADLLSEAGQNIISTLFKEVESRKTLENVVKEIRSPIDWSKAESIAIPEPRCAIVNFSGINSMPTSKTADIPAVMEFWDMQGNYFKKNILCSAQGNSSMGYIKKNVKFDLLNEDGSEFNLKIGGWVVQDGFHLKAYYTDFFRGVGAVSYKFYDEIMRFNGLNTDRPYKKVLLNIEEIATNALGEGDISDLELQLDTGALCHPDGFPCIVYLNGEFYGIFSWQIKKQRKNYHLDKSTVEHIHLDGSLYTSNLWNGVINWSVFEIRNPNKLYTMDGKKYDGDSPKELIDETSAKYDPSNKDHKRSAQVKKYIQDLVTNFAELKSLYSTYRTSDPDRVKAKYQEIFDVDNQRDYLIFGDVIKNSDGFGKIGSG